MMHLFINSLAASAGGGLTYTRNIIPHLAAHHDARVTLAVSPRFRRDLPDLENVEFLELDIPPTQRFWFEQRKLPDLIRKSGADLLLSAGNFALRKSPVPQMLLSRNSIYTSADFYRDLQQRGEYRMWIDTRVRAILARRSVQWADTTVAPSRAFAEELERWTGREINAVYHGFDRNAFTHDPGPLSRDVELKLEETAGSFKILFVSHYNYYRNFETLIRSLPIVQQRLGKRPVRLLLTCELAPGKNPGAYRTESAVRLIHELNVSGLVVELGAIPYSKLHHLYSRSDVYVTPAYTETFAHPLVEAMSSGIPVVASDIPVHREICGDAALYFARFSPDELAHRVFQIAERKDLSAAMVSAGLLRSNQFSWQTHIQQILQLAENLFPATGIPNISR